MSSTTENETQHELKKKNLKLGDCNQFFTVAFTVYVVVQAAARSVVA